MQVLLCDDFYYNSLQNEVEKRLKLSSTKLENAEYDAYIVKNDAVYFDIAARQVFYFKDNLLKHILYIIEKENNVLSILDDVVSTGFCAVAGTESKNLPAIIKVNKNNKYIDFIGDKEAYTKFKTMVEQKQNAYSIIFFDISKIDEKISDYATLYKKLSDESVVKYVNIDLNSQLVYIGLCLPKQEAFESI